MPKQLVSVLKSLKVLSDFCMSFDEYFSKTHWSSQFNYLKWKGRKNQYIMLKQENILITLKSLSSQDSPSFVDLHIKLMAWVTLVNTKTFKVRQSSCWCCRTLYHACVSVPKHNHFFPQCVVYPSQFLWRSPCRADHVFHMNLTNDLKCSCTRLVNVRCHVCVCVFYKTT